MEREIWIVEKCEHGKTEAHEEWDNFTRVTISCPGGSRRVVTIDYEKAAKQYWYESGSVDGQWPTLWEPANESIREHAKKVVDAALGLSDV